MTLYTAYGSALSSRLFHEILITVQRKDHAITEAYCWLEDDEYLYPNYISTDRMAKPIMCMALWLIIYKILMTIGT